MDSLGTRIRQARERRGMSQGELAKELGVSLRTVGNWERDETHPRNSLTRIEDLLGPVTGAGGALSGEGTLSGQRNVTPGNPRPEGEIDRPSVRSDGEADDELVFRLRVPPGASPRERDRARRAAEAAARAVLEEFDEE